MISAKNITVKTKSATILDDVTFCPEKGKITAVLGLNGSGKTTLLRVLSGNNPRFKGDVEIDGVQLKTYKEKDRAKKVSYMPQVMPRPAIPVYDLISYGRFPYIDRGLSLSDEDKTAIDNAVAMTKLENKLNSQVCHLSGGERQLSYFAMVLAQNRDTVLLDEPVSGLDTTVKVLFYDIVRKLKEQGKTVVITIHDINDAVNIADNIFVLDKGRCIFDGNTEDFCNSDIPENVFSVRKIKTSDTNKTLFYYKD